MNYNYILGCSAPQYPTYLSGAVLVSTGVVRLDKRAAAPDRDKTGTF